MDHEMVIFTRVFDLLEWLLPKSERFPCAYRSTVTQRLMDAALDLQEALTAAEARMGRARLAALRDADAALGRLVHLSAARPPLALAERRAVCACRRHGG
ncbi:MAG: hypothetical protein ACXW3X_17435 [Rhodoplanes sp.]